MTDFTSNFADLGLDPPKRRRKSLDPLGLPPELSNPYAVPGIPGSNKRKRPRVGIDELNTMGVAAVKAKYPNLPDQIQDTDPRSGFEKVLDWIDVPRNLVGNAIGYLAGVDTGKLPKAAFGLPRVSMSDVLNKLGVETGVGRAVIGFVGDVAIDPLTYIGGVGVKVAKYANPVLKGGMKAARALASGDLAVEGAADLARTLGRGTRTVKEAAGVLDKLKGRAGRMAAEALGEGASDVERSLARDAGMASFTKNLAGKKGGRLLSGAAAKLGDETPAGQAAREFFKNPAMAYPGRPIARIPFTELGIGQIPFGRGKRVADAIKTADISDPIFQRIRDLRALASKAGKTAAVTEAVRNAVSEVKRARSAERVAIAGGEAGANYPSASISDALAAARDLKVQKTAKISDVEAAAKAYSEGIPEAVGGKYGGLPGSQVIPTRTGAVDQIGKKGKALKGKLADMRGVQASALNELKKQQIGGVGPDILELVHGSELAKGSPWNPTGLRQRILGWMSRTGYHGKAIEENLTEAIRAGKGPFKDALGPGGYDQRIRDLLAKGYGGPKNDPEIVRKMVRDAVEVAPRAGKDYLAERHASDPVLRKWNAEGLSRFASEPEVQRIIAFSDKWHAEMEARGALKKVNKIVDEIGMWHRIQTPEAMAAMDKQKGVGVGQRGVRPSRAQMAPDFRLANDTPFDLSRTRQIELTQMTDGGKGVPIKGTTQVLLTTQESTIRKLMAAGYRPTHEGTVVADKTKVLLRGFNATEDNIKAMAEKGIVVDPVEKSWMPSSAFYDEAAKGGQLQTLYGEAAKDLPGVMNADLPRSMGAYARGFERQQAGQDLVQWAGQHKVVFTDPEIQAGRPELQGYAAVPDLPADHPLLKMLPQGLLDPPPNGGQTFLPREMAESIRELANIVAPGGIHPTAEALLKVSDGFMKWFKFNALLSPAYTIRNIWQNVVGIASAGGSPAGMLKWWYHINANKDFKAVLRAIDNGTVDMLPNKLLSIGSQRVSMRQLGQFLVSRGAESAGLTGAEFAPGALRGAGGAGADMVRKIVGGAVYSFPRNYRRMNQGVESGMRIGAILSFMEQGVGMEEAYFKTLLGMPDLNALSKFERDKVARIFPWWRWIRNNGSVQVMHHLTAHPAFMAGASKLQHLIEGLSASWRPMAGNVPAELRPEWQREGQAAQVWGDKNQGATFLLKPWLPFQEAQEMASGLVQPSEAARGILSAMRPELKFLVESGSGTDLFRNRPINQLSTPDLLASIPSALRGKGESQPLANALGVRALKEYLPGGRVYDQPSVGSGIGRAFLGGAVQPVNAQSGLRALDYETQQKMTELRRQIARAQSANDKNGVMDLLRQLVAVQQRRAKLGLPLAKKGRAVLQAAGMVPGSDYPDIPYEKQ